MGDALGTGRAGDQRPVEQKQSQFQTYDDAPSVVTLPTPGWGDDAQGLGGSGTGTGGSGMDTGGGATGGSGGGTGGSGMLRTDTMQEKGIIRSVSDKGMTISIPKKDRIVTLRVDDQAQLLRGDQPLALSSLQVGDEVRATYQFNEDGDKVLRGLEVTRERAAQAKKK